MKMRHFKTNRIKIGAVFTSQDIFEVSSAQCMISKQHNILPKFTDLTSS